MFFEPICWSPTCVDNAIIAVNHKSFLMRRPSSRKDCLFKWNECFCHKIVTVYFDIISESVDNMKSLGFDMIINMNFLLWISSLGFVTMLSLDRVHMRHGDIFKKNHNSLPITKCYQLSHSAAYKNNNIALAYSFRLSRKSCLNRYGTQCKYNNLKLIKSCKCNNIIE
jgi:hypothetical protein